MFMLLVKVPVKSRLLVKFGGSKNYTWIFDCTGGSTPNPHIIQGPTTFLMMATTSPIPHALLTITLPLLIKEKQLIPFPFNLSYHVTASMRRMWKK